MCPLICFQTSVFHHLDRASTWICPEHRKKIFWDFIKCCVSVCRSICTMFKQSAEINSIVQTFECYTYFQAMVTSSCWSHLCTIGSTSKWTEKTDKCQKPSVLFHVICNLSFVTHPPFAVLLLWDLCRSPATSSRACLPSSFTCSLQPG